MIDKPKVSLREPDRRPVDELRGRAHRDVSQRAGVVGLTNEIKVKTQRPADAWWRS